MLIVSDNTAWPWRLFQLQAWSEIQGPFSPRIIIAREQAMHAERHIVLPTLSVCPSNAITVSKEWTMDTLVDGLLGT